MGRVKRSRLLAAGGVPLLAAAAVVVSSVVGPSAAGSANVPNVPVTHVIEIMIENHSFDNLFGQFPGADGIPMRDGKPTALRALAGRDGFAPPM